VHLTGRNVLKASMNWEPSVVTIGWNLSPSAIEGLTGLSKSYYNITMNLTIKQVLYNRIIKSRRNGNVRLRQMVLPNNPSLSDHLT